MTNAELAEALRQAAPSVDDYATFDAILARADQLDPHARPDRSAEE